MSSEFTTLSLLTYSLALIGIFAFPIVRQRVPRVMVALLVIVPWAAALFAGALTQESSSCNDFYAMKREVMSSELCVANTDIFDICQAILYDLESRLYKNDVGDRRKLQQVINQIDLPFEIYTSREGDFDNFDFLYSFHDRTIIFDVQRTGGSSGSEDRLSEYIVEAFSTPNKIDDFKNEVVWSRFATAAADIRTDSFDIGRFEQQSWVGLDIHSKLADSS